MVEYWSIADIKNKILSPEIKVGEYYFCSDRVYSEEIIFFIITDITKEKYGWRIWKKINKLTGEIKIANGKEFGSSGEINKRGFHKEIKNGTYKKFYRNDLR